MEPICHTSIRHLITAIKMLINAPRRRTKEKNLQFESTGPHLNETNIKIKKNKQKTTREK